MPQQAQRSGDRSPSTAAVYPAARQTESVNEGELLRTVRAGDRRGAIALYDLVYPSVARSLQRVLHRAGSDYDDLVQITFERIMRAIVDPKGERVINLCAWASGVATHVALDALRSRIRERGLFRADDPASGHSILELADSASAERDLEARWQLQVVQEVLGRMKDTFATTVVLHDMLGHDLAETAVLTNVSVAAAQSRLVRGRKELLRRVEQRLNKGAK
jgi:RNA polymerase sigma-70 factor (ECF subfamily)